MAPPIYFLPGVTRGRFIGHWDATVQAAGLAEVLADIRDPVAECIVADLKGKTPGGAAGCILIALPRNGECPQRTGYMPEFQDWQAAEDSAGRVWIGLDKHEPTRPEDVARAACTRGEPVRLGDGQEWLVHVVRDPRDIGDPEASFTPTTLPMKQVKRDGKWWEVVHEKYRDLWNEAAELFDVMRFSPSHEWPMDQLMDYALRVLSANYRISAAESERLDLFSGDIWQEVVAVSFGSRLEVDLKKSALSR